MNKPRILALDPASATGWACGRADERPVHGTLKMPKRDVMGERLLALFHALRGIIRANEPELIAYELPFMPRASDMNSMWHVVQMAQKIEGIVMLVAAEASIPADGYTSQSWRLGFMGFGRAPKGGTKDHMKKACMARVRMLGYEPGSMDAAEAIGIWHYAAMGKPASERAQGDLLAAAAARL